MRPVPPELASAGPGKPLSEAEPVFPSRVWLQADEVGQKDTTAVLLGCSWDTRYCLCWFMLSLLLYFSPLGGLT